MVFTSNSLQRIFIWKILATFLPGLCISVFFGMYCNSFWIFLWLLLMVQVLFIIRYAFHYIIDKCVFHIIFREQMEEEFYNILLKSNFPKPEKYEVSVLDYFCKIADDELLNVKTRLVSTAIFSVLGNYYIKKSIRSYLTRHYEKALMKYEKFLQSHETSKRSAN